MPRIEIDGLSKAFGVTRALDSVSLHLDHGEVHGLVGHNGSGKSTLIKVLAGYHDPDGGRLRVDGSDVPLPLSSARAAAIGFAFVHQNLALMPRLTVMDNLHASRYALGSSWFISRRKEVQRTSLELSEYGVAVDPMWTVESLSGGQRAQIAILRALKQAGAGMSSAAPGRGGLLVLDEPTVFLDEQERRTLYGTIRRLKGAGFSTLFVSHDLDEVLSICDVVTVMRDGKAIETGTASKDSSKSHLVRLVTGNKETTSVEPVELDERVPRALLFAVEDLVGGRLEGISFSVSAGEIIGLTGMLGSGFEDIAKYAFGALRARQGYLEVAGCRHDLHRITPARAVRAGIAYVPEDREGAGQASSLAMYENVSLLVLKRYFGLRRRRLRRMKQDAKVLAEEYSVVPSDESLKVSQFSGGNQQKVLLAKWFRTQPWVLLLSEPTQGVDAGARQDIFQLLRAHAARGAAVVVASSDLDQLAQLCDRVLIVRDGVVATEVSKPEVTKYSLSAACYGEYATAGSETRADFESLGADVDR